MSAILTSMLSGAKIATIGPTYLTKLVRTARYLCTSFSLGDLLLTSLKEEIPGGLGRLQIQVLEVEAPIFMRKVTKFIVKPRLHWGRVSFKLLDTVKFYVECVGALGF